MSDNQDNKREAKWYELPLKDWVIIVGALFYYFNQSAAVRSYDEKLKTLVETAAKMETTQKEMEKQYRIMENTFNEKLNKIYIEQEVLKQRIQVLESKR